MVHPVSSSKLLIPSCCPLCLLLVSAPGAGGSGPVIMACATIHVGFTVPQLLRGVSRILPTHSALVVLRHSAFCYCTVNSTIKSKRKMDHLERTANNFRQEVISQAKVCGISNESETVKRLRLAITNKDFTFKAGQWVDFFIPGMSVVGGFSMCSSPGLLKREGILELAVKHTDHPPAHWIHTECTLDSEVALRVGADLHGYQEGKGNGYKMGTVKLYYSAKNSSQLLFKKNILGLMNAFPGKIMCHFHVTQQSSPICEELQPHVTEGRISEKDLEKHVSKDTVWYICGPPPMIESISKLLSDIGVPRNCIFFEKWW
ncbi:oxidoreductase NAD-binding domain-containing protein 1 isoform X3 [Pezoporus wallicus]|uniref:oxidoreductase NAD-binding domain-containing protein 1 isoform X3 n=1 Tax=Pezoporus wallicus TaxID=35540 RepID=UPI00254DC101|nr:oxidoreductase NAD-binding domain-containing protein 1 isoform X3 [Pezoporus wallicus]XP_061320874.1 oxidoreductase NAD-binding domain-containing protein 1 isoform X3 [Pezoporus flaviventris]